MYYAIVPLSKQILIAMNIIVWYWGHAMLFIVDLTSTVSLDYRRDCFVAPLHCTLGFGSLSQRRNEGM